MASPGARSAGSDFDENEKVKRKRLKRIPIADLELFSFQRDRSVQGTVILCEPIPKSSAVSRLIVLKDIVVSPKSAIAAAGLDPRESDERFESQTKRRGEDVAVAHTIHVTLVGLFSQIQVALGDVVHLKGSDISVSVNVSKEETSDHHLQITVEKGNSEIEVISTLQDSIGAARKKQGLSTYADKAVRYYMEENEIKSETRVLKKLHPEVDFVRLAELKVNEEYQNTYGVVVNVNFPSRTAKGTWRLAIHLIDETHPQPENPIEVCAFASREHILGYFPQMVCFGTIVRLHRVKVSTFQDNKSLRMTNHVTTMTTTGMIPGNREQFDMVTEGATSKTALDWNRVEQLRSFAAGIISQGGNPGFLYNRYLKTLTETLNSQTVDKSMVDVLVRCVTVPVADPRAEEGEGYSFQVTDGPSTATIVLRREPSTEAQEPPAHYWPLVAQFVGDNPGAWIKIRNCQIWKADRMLFVFCGDGNLKATSFIRVPSEFCRDTPGFVPHASTVAPPSIPRRIVSQINAGAQSLRPALLCDIISRKVDSPYRTVVRVVNTFPSDIVQMCLSRSDGLFSWKLALQLEDTTGRVDAVLAGEDATEFFQLQPVDLSSNEECRKIVELSVSTLRSDNCWLDCVLVPLIETSKVFSIVDTVVRV